MDDDDKTPPRGRRLRTHMGDGDRALGGRRRAPAHGVPVVRNQLDDLEAAIDESDTPVQAVDEGEEISRPIDIGRPLTPIEQQFWQRQDRLKMLVLRSRKESSDQILEAMGRRPPNERISQLETRMKILYGVLTAIAIAALGSVLATAKLLYERGVAAGEQAQQIKELEQVHDRDAGRIDRLEREIADSRRRSEQPDHSGFLQPRTIP